MLRWIEETVAGLPKRTTPLICMDANARTGTRPRTAHRPRCVGPYNDEPPDWTGVRLMEVLDRLGLVLLNTFFRNASGPTFSGGEEKHSRIDYIAAPTKLQTVVQCVRAVYHEAQLMQLPSSSKWLDHAPVYLRFWHRDWYEQDPDESALASAELKWNKRALRDLTLDPDRGKELRAQLDV